MLTAGSYSWSTSSIGPYKLPEIWLEPCLASAEHTDPLAIKADPSEKHWLISWIPWVPCHELEIAGKNREESCHRRWLMFFSWSHSIVILNDRVKSLRQLQSNSPSESSKVCPWAQWSKFAVDPFDIVDPLDLRARSTKWQEIKKGSIRRTPRGLPKTQATARNLPGNFSNQQEITLLPLETVRKGLQRGVVQSWGCDYKAKVHFDHSWTVLEIHGTTDWKTGLKQQATVTIGHHLQNPLWPSHKQSSKRHEPCKWSDNFAQPRWTACGLWLTCSTGPGTIFSWNRWAYPFDMQQIINLR